MSLLNKGLIFCMVLASAVSCNSRGPLSPGEAFKELNRAFVNRDAASFKKLLSEGSIKKIKIVTGMFSRMNDDQLKSVSRLYGVEMDKMKKLTVDDFIVIYLSSEKSLVVANALTLKITAVDRKKESATIRVESGAQLNFVREGPYWKFDLTRL